MSYSLEELHLKNGGKTNDPIMKMLRMIDESLDRAYIKGFRDGLREAERKTKKAE